jgi:hypothetical protein
MLGPRITTVFRSRWNALFWAAGVLMTAYCSVPDADETMTAPVAAVVGAKTPPPAPHKNPWAKD